MKPRFKRCVAATNPHGWTSALYILNDSARRRFHPLRYVLANCLKRIFLGVWSPSAVLLRRLVAERCTRVFSPHSAHSCDFEEVVSPRTDSLSLLVLYHRRISRTGHGRRVHIGM